jgi:DNA-directed RNA polymerase specialized sigma24 family protein
MSQTIPMPWQPAADRPTDADLCAWLRSGRGNEAAARSSLSGAVAPLLAAFFEGQLGAQHPSVDAMVSDVLDDAWQQRHDYDGSLPLRAWMLDMARVRMVGHRARVVAVAHAASVAA